MSCRDACRVRSVQEPTSYARLPRTINSVFGKSERAELRPAERRKRRSPPGLRHPLLEHNYPRTKVVRAATASERPSVGHSRARSNEPARTPLGPPGQYEASTNDEPRHQPARPETRPNQRLYVPLGSPPSVAVGSSSARAAHLSRAPQTHISRMTLIAARVKISRHRIWEQMSLAISRVRANSRA